MSGVTCKKIKSRYSNDIIEYLLKIEWWNWSEEKIKKNEEFFYTSLGNIKVSELMKIIKD